MEDHKLTKEEICSFYELLYKYEHESHAGYKDEEVVKKLKNDLIFDDNYEPKGNIIGEVENTLKFSPYRNNKCWAILYHVRNAFAHGNIKSVENDKYFLIQDYSDKSKRLKCNMLAKIEKEKFFDLIDIINATRKQNNQ